MPFALSEIEILGDIPVNCYAYATVDEMAGRLPKYNIRICDAAGQVRVRIRDLVLKAIRADELQSTATVLKYYTEEWQKAAVKLEPEPETPEPVLLFAGETELKELLKQKRTGTLIGVRPGSGFRLDENDIYEINPLDPEDYLKLLVDLKGKNRDSGTDHSLVGQ